MYQFILSKMYVALSDSMDFKNEKTIPTESKKQSTIETNKDIM